MKAGCSKRKFWVDSRGQNHVNKEETISMTLDHIIATCTVISTALQLVHLACDLVKQSNKRGKEGPKPPYFLFVPEKYLSLGLTN